MASTAAERKQKERDDKREKGMTLKQIWLLPETIKIINDYKAKYSTKDRKVSDEDAINDLIKKTTQFE